MSMAAYLIVALVGVAAFAASLMLEKREGVPVGAPPPKERLINTLRLGGVILATLGLVGMAILSASAVPG
jgi:hypothetical protein